MKSVLLNDDGYTENGKWRLVVVDPKPEMSAKGLCISEAEHDPAGVYRAMIAASPAPVLAEADLERLRSQEPVVVISSPEWDAMQKGEDACCSKFDREMDCSRTMPVLLYAEPKPPTHPGATHCDNCGCTWLDDGINPLGCPYCEAKHHD